MDRGGRGKISVVVVVCVGVCAVCCVLVCLCTPIVENPNQSLLVATRLRPLAWSNCSLGAFPSHPIPKDTGHRGCPLCSDDQGQVYSRPVCGLGQGAVEEARRTGSCGGLVCGWGSEGRGEREQWGPTHPVTKNCGCAGLSHLHLIHKACV